VLGLEQPCHWVLPSHRRECPIHASTQQDVPVSVSNKTPFHVLVRKVLYSVDNAFKLSVNKQNVALTEHNRIGSPCRVGHLTTHTPAQRPPTAHAPAGSVTDNDRQQTPASETILIH